MECELTTFGEQDPNIPASALCLFWWLVLCLGHKVLYSSPRTFFQEKILFYVVCHQKIQ